MLDLAHPVFACRHENMLRVESNPYWICPDCDWRFKKVKPEWAGPMGDFLARWPVQAPVLVPEPVLMIGLDPAKDWSGVKEIVSETFSGIVVVGLNHFLDHPEEVIATARRVQEEHRPRAAGPRP